MMGMVEAAIYRRSIDADEL